MTGMVEKIGRAIDAAAEKYIKDWHVKCGKDKTLIPYIGMADVPPDVLGRAALQAMREPTEEMVAAGAQRASGFASAGNRMCNGYRAMIDRAIKENAE